jgi:hypothetical protein
MSFIGVDGITWSFRVDALAGMLKTRRRRERSIGLSFVGRVTGEVDLYVIYHLMFYGVLLIMI